MRTLIVGDHIEIEGRTVGHILPGTMASHQDHLRKLIDRGDENYEEDETDSEMLQEVEGCLSRFGVSLDHYSSRIDSFEGEGAAKVLHVLGLITADIEKLDTNENVPLKDAMAGIGNVIESLAAWLDTDTKARDRLAAEVETAAATGYTDEQARAKLPVVEAALAHANGRVTELTARLAECERDNETLRPMMKRLTAQAGSDNHAHLAEVEALRRQNETQAGEIRRLSDAAGHARAELAKQHKAHADAVSKARAAGVVEGRASAGSAGTVTAPVTPASPIGFDGAATRLYLHLQMQAHKLDPATKKLVQAVGKAMG